MRIVPVAWRARAVRRMALQCSREERDRSQLRGDREAGRSPWRAGELAKAKQIESGHVFQESHAVDRFPFDSPGLLNDPLDLVFGTDYLYGHSDNLDREFQRMSSCGQRAALDVMSGYLDDWARQGEHLRVGVGDADNAGVAELLAAELAESKSVVELVRYNIGPSVAVHTGPGTVGAVWTAI